MFLRIPIWIIEICQIVRKLQNGIPYVDFEFRITHIFSDIYHSSFRLSFFVLN